MKRAVVLLSGGLDSATVLSLAQQEGYEAHALSFAYGQRHSVELEAARRIARGAGVFDHRIAEIDLRLFGGSALTDRIDVPKARRLEEIGQGIPVTYVPARNTIFLSFALAYAEVLDAHDIFIGVNALDYSGYPDCRPDYIDAYEAMANLATAHAGQKRIRIRTPLIDLDKAAIVTLAQRLGVDLAATISCYDPDAKGRACRHCDACLLRAKGFAESGIADPTPYQEAS